MKLIDAFMFFTEIELLEIRLHELDPIVDYFVIVESLECHGSRNKKEPVLYNNWDVVKPFKHKVRYLLLEKLDPEFTDPASGWLRENYQRERLLPAVLEVADSPDDILILSDCDEIPRAQALIDNRERWAAAIHRIGVDLFYYNVNSYTNVGWARSTIGPLRGYQNAGGLNKVRDGAGISGTILDGGWHFSYFGDDVARLRNKVENFAHASDPAQKWFLTRTDADIARDVLAGDDIFHRGKTETARPTDDPRLPRYFLDNLAKFENLTEEGFRKRNM